MWPIVMWHSWMRAVFFDGTASRRSHKPAHAPPPSPVSGARGVAGGRRRVRASPFARLQAANHVSRVAARRHGDDHIAGLDPSLDLSCEHEIVAIVVR